MATSKGRGQKGTQDPLKRNEPAPKLRGGARRPSMKVARPPLAARREQLERMLIAHDLERAERPALKLTGNDYAILRQIALEGALAHALPGVREHAILALAGKPSPENLNVLADLARHGEDHLVRGHALLALGASGVRLATVALVEGLSAEHAFERAAAERGLLTLGMKLGAPVVRAALADPELAAVRARIEAALSAGAKSSGKRRVTESESKK
jgi:HEAT repeat protein